SAVFDRAAIGIARLGLDGRIIEANPALEAMLGRTENRLVGAELMSLVHRDDRDHRALRALARGETAEYQAELRYSRAGEHVWGNTIASAVRGPSSEPLFLIAMVEDITLRKVHEAALEHRALHDPLTDLPDVGGPEGAQSGADKLIAALRRPFRVEGHQVRVSASIGIALFPGDGDDGDLLMRMADTAMYAAKRSGGGCRAYEKEPA